MASPGDGGGVPARDADARIAVSPRRRLRSGRAVVLGLSLVGTLWWATGGEELAGLRPLGDPETYERLVGTVGTWLGTAVLTPEVSVVADPTAVPSPAPAGLGAIRETPPIGLGEEEERLAPPVTVPRDHPAYGFSAVQDDGVSPVAWSPCRPIHYVINHAGAPPEFAAQMRSALDELSAATGLVFVDDGVTDEKPSQERGAYLPERYGDRWAPVLIAVADPATIDFLEGDTAGVAYTYRVRGLESGRWHLMSGSVYVDSEAFELDADVHGEPGWTTVLRHELGHLIGLDHIDDPTQLMNPVTTRQVHTYQAGDLSGLARLGQGACAPDA